MKIFTFKDKSTSDEPMSWGLPPTSEDAYPTSHCIQFAFDAHPETKLLLTDVGLPGGMNGRELAGEALRRKAGLRVLFASGYARNAIVHHGRLDPGVDLIMKPFTYADLAAKVRRVLDGR